MENDIIRADYMMLYIDCVDIQHNVCLGKPIDHTPFQNWRALCSFRDGKKTQFKKRLAFSPFRYDTKYQNINVQSMYSKTMHCLDIIQDFNSQLVWIASETLTLPPIHRSRPLPTVMKPVWIESETVSIRTYCMQKQCKSITRSGYHPRL